MSHVTFYIKADKSSSDEEINFLNDKYSNHSVGHKGDAGLDLYCPRSKNITAGTTSNKINLGINCELMDEFGNNLPYLLMPRSSTGSKTPLRMSNSLGLIDAGYRGPICACVDNVSNLNLIAFNSFELKLLKIFIKNTKEDLEKLNSFFQNLNDTKILQYMITLKEKDIKFFYEYSLNDIKELEKQYEIKNFKWFLKKIGYCKIEGIYFLKKEVLEDLKLLK